jgi:TonB family protein
MIKRLLLSTLIAVVCPAGLMANDKQAAQDLLKAAAQQIFLLDDSAKPFVMDVDFTAKLDQPMEGHLRLRWESKDRWWSKVTWGPFEQVTSLNGDKWYTLRNGDFTPLRLRELMDLLHVTKDFDKLLAKKEKLRAEGGLRVDCVEAERLHMDGQQEEVCLDASTHWIVKHRATDPVDDQTSRYSDFAEFGGRIYPRRFQLDKNGQTVITAIVTELKQEALDPRLLVPPPGAIERRSCADPTLPKELTQHGPDFSDLQWPVGASATSIVEVTVRADGSVGGVHVIESGGQAMDEAWMKAVKKFTFKPAMCGTEPIDFETIQGIWRQSTIIRN